MAFVLVSLIVLFIMSMVSNRFSQMSTQRFPVRNFWKKWKQVKSNPVEIGSGRDRHHTGDKGQESVPADLLLWTCGRRGSDPAFKRKRRRNLRSNPGQHFPFWVCLLSFLLPLLLIWILMGILMKRMGGLMSVAREHCKSLCGKNHRHYL